MKQPEIIPGVFAPNVVRMPTTIQDYGIDINGWHEGNALMTPVWYLLNVIKQGGVETYVRTYSYDQGRTFTFADKMNATNSRAGGIEYLYDNILKDKMKSIGTLLDIGCGQGEFGIWCSTAGVKYTGVDVAMVNVGFAYAILPCLKFKRPECTMPEYKQMLAEDLAFPDKTFDMVFTSHSVEHVHDLDQAFAEQFRVGREICGVVAKPKEDEGGEHMQQISQEMLERYLSENCTEYTIHEMELERVIWGVTK